MVSKNIFEKIDFFFTKMLYGTKFLYIFVLQITYLLI